MSKDTKWITIGISREGEVYGLELNADGTDFDRNSLGYSTSCAVIRPVTRETLDYYRDDMDSVKDIWKDAVANDKTEDSLEDYFESLLPDCESVFSTNDEAWPFKDESFCEDLLIDMDNPTVKTYFLIADNLRQCVEDAIMENPDIKTPNGEIATWECAGWFPPKEPFVVELADHELIERYYKHLEETDREFKR